MTDSAYIIFYSWQSDLPNSTTRGLIESSIEAAAKSLKNTATVLADRDTQGVTGAPDIVQTIFSKIDECDVFVADVTSVAAYYHLDNNGKPTKRLKETPNANVMIELGYATQVVGWENIICVMNDDYSKGGEIPFDLEHHRLTHFSLKDREKADVRKELRGIIADTVMNAMENGKRVKGEFSNIQVGAYDAENDCIVSQLIPLSLRERPSIVAEIEFLTDSAKKLVEDICCIVLTSKTVDMVTDEKEALKEAEPIVREDGTVLTPITNGFSLDLFKSHYFEVKDSEKDFTRERVGLLFGIELDESFFDFGGLQVRSTFGLSPSSELLGSDEEIDKYNKYVELNGLLAEIDLWEMYITTFDEYFLFPLAIANVSSISDNGIKVYIEVDSEKAEVVLPTANVINPLLEGVEGTIYENDLIRRTLQMEESARITYEKDISISRMDAQYDIQACLKGGINGTPRYTEEDYERELAKYIASTINSDTYSFAFEIDSLNAQEKKWLGPLLLIKPLDTAVSLRYTIKSNKSDGSLSGILCSGE